MLSLGRGTLDRAAGFPPSRKVPFVWESDALAWLHRLDHAFVALKENADPIRLVNQGEPITIWSQAGMGLDKCGFLHPKILRDC